MVEPPFHLPRKKAPPPPSRILLSPANLLFRDGICGEKKRPHATLLWKITRGRRGLVQKGRETPLPQAYMSICQPGGRLPLWVWFARGPCKPALTKVCKDYSTLVLEASNLWLHFLYASIFLFGGRCAKARARVRHRLTCIRKFGFILWFFWCKGKGHQRKEPKLAGWHTHARTHVGQTWQTGRQAGWRLVDG